MHESRFFRNRNIVAWTAAGLAVMALTLGALVVTARAQSSRMSPNQGEQDGVAAGGGWSEYRSDDKMTGAKKVRFELVANNYFKEDPEFKPRVELFCSAGKMTLADFNPGVKLGPPNRPGFWGQPQMEVRVRIDDYNGYHGWNWVRGHFLSMDKGTVRGMIGAQVFNVQLRTRGGWQIAEFSPAGVDLNRVKDSCGLKPKKP